jgi:hypothetical protein
MPARTVPGRVGAMRPSLGGWRPFVLLVRVFTRGLALVRAIVPEWKRAVAATHRYEQLKRITRARDAPATDAARQIYMEFYSDGAWCHRGSRCRRYADGADRGGQR